MQKGYIQSRGKCPKLPWMIDFHSTADGILSNQLRAAFADTYLEHLASLNQRSAFRAKRLTQFLVVIPNRVPMEHLEKFLDAGMTVAVLRLDYFTVEELKDTLHLIKLVNDEFGKKIKRPYPLAIAVDLSEPEIKTGKLQQPLKEVELKKGDITRVSNNSIYKRNGSKDNIYVDFDQLPALVKPGDELILGDNEIRLRALSVVKEIIDCIIEKAGVLTDNLSVTLPNILLTPSLTETEDKLEAIKEEECEVNIAFAGPSKIDSIRTMLGPSILYFLKLEYVSTLPLFDEMVHQIDGILIDGDKLMRSSQENYFIVQKSTIAKCNKLEKPVISTINCHSITKAQVNDIANTVIDGIDGVLIPPDPDLVGSISLICQSAENCIYQKRLFEDLCQLKQPPIEPITSVSMAAVEASFKSNAAAIILITSTGRSARLISMFKPRCPIIALTRFPRIAKQLGMFKGVIPLFYKRVADDTFEENVEKSMQLGMTFGKLSGYIKMGDAVVIVFGIRNHVGFRNCMEVVFASEYDTLE